MFATVYWVNVRHGLEVHDWQVLNEPDSGRGQGWGGTLQDYLDFTKLTHDAIQHVYTTLPAQGRPSGCMRPWPKA